MELLEGEELRFAPISPANSVRVSDELINEKYVRGEIRIVTEQARYPLNSVPAMIDSSSYTLSPEYQRRHRWSPEQQSRLIESLIMNVPIPPIFLYEYDYSKYEVMDGLQRLVAIREFYNDKIVLIGLTQWPELNGLKYSDLPEKVREGIDRRYLSSVILLKETAHSDEDALRLKQMVFERINSGGTKLTPQETRNAIFDGPLNRLCMSLSKHPSLCRLWDIPIPDEQELAGGEPTNERTHNDDFRRMQDVELVLRFFAYRQKHKLHKGGPLAAYLDAYLRYGNGFSNETLAQMERLFVDTIQLIEDTFGERAFWMLRNRRDHWAWLERPTTVVYDPLMAVVSRHLDSAAVIRRKADLIQNDIAEFYKYNYGIFEGRNVNPSALAEREVELDKFFVQVIAGT